MASYSSRGPTWYDGFAKPDIVAPGDALKSDRAPGSTLDKLIPSQCDATTGERRGFVSLSGTSMATAVASGVVALALQQNHALFPTTYLTSHTVKADPGIHGDPAA